MSALLLKGGRVIDPAAQRDEICDILIEDGVIRQVGKDLSANGAEVYDASGKIVTPGFIDMHTHFREPGQEAKEDFSSGSRAGAAGGYTTIATMPNTRPVVDDAALVTSLIKRAEDVAVIHIRIIGAVTKNQEGKELAELGDMVEAGAVAFSDDGHYDPSAKVLLSAYDYLVPFDKAIINHEEDTSLVEDGAMNEGHRSAMLGIKGRPIVAEDIAVARDIMLAEYAGAHVHVAHISSGRAVQLVREAKVRGVRATTEVTPHHLTLTDECVDPRDSSTKVNPPLRTAKDVEAMVAGLLDGTIEMIVTDHSPHAPEEKDREYIYAPSGFPGLETAFGVLLTDLVHTGKVPLATLIERMTYGPARVFKLNAGTLGEGAPADVTVIDPELQWTVDVNKFYTRGRHSPFNGRQLKGKAVLTVVDGKIVMKDGVIVV
mgnify:FL=1